MRFVSAIIVAAGLAVAPAAQAADWWWVAGDPGDSHAWFVDADSINGSGDEVSFQQMHITRAGPAAAEMRTVSCGGHRNDPVERFVCASDEERLSIGAMLGPVAPQVAAAAIFTTPPLQSAQR